MKKLIHMQVVNKQLWSSAGFGEAGMSGVEELNEAGGQEPINALLITQDTL